MPVQMSLPSCIVRPEQTLGPYFVDEMLNRSDITFDPSDGSVKEGVPLQLVINVSRLDGRSCTALAGATVDIWHCDAAGIYSDVEDPGFNTRGQTFLRGYQMTDLDGKAEFTTIFPGWYQGRTVHIHFKIRTTESSQQAYDFTSQLYFDDSLTDEVHVQSPYTSKGQRTIRNGSDGIYRSGGDQLTLEANRTGDGYTGTFNIGLEMT
jgi:protocatechuate 3,4-dioxygenase beta subunit